MDPKPHPIVDEVANNCVAHGRGETLVIVVPCFNEQDVLPETARRLDLLIDSLVTACDIDAHSGVLFVDDGSDDATWQLIEELSRTHPRFAGIKLSRNRGHQNALLAGLHVAAGDIVVSIDADLQDDINAIRDMIALYRSGSDIVYGVRNQRSTDGRFKRWSALAFYRLMGLLGAESIDNHADFRLMSRKAVDSLKDYREVNLYLRGMIPQLGFSSATVVYDRAERFAGESKYPLKKMLALALDGVTSFSTVPLRIITLVGFLVFAGSFAMGLWTLWVRLFTDMALPGWTSTLLPIYFLGGIQILALGIIGEYMGKAYQEIKARPRYLVERTTSPVNRVATTGEGRGG